MSTISNTITHGITLATSGTYASPLTITSVGYVVDNSGTQDAVYGPATQGWTLVNEGRLASSGRSGINLRAGGLVDNSGTIVGTAKTGVYIAGAAGTVVNAGTIIGGATSGVHLFSGLVANQAGGFITSTTGRGISVAGGAGTVTNLGSISGPNDCGITLFAGGEIINGSSAAAGAVISGNQVAVQLLTTPGRIVNYATIIGVVGGVNAQNTTATISNMGLISAGSWGADFQGQPSTVINAGTIVASGTAGIGLRIAGGTVDNTGTISAAITGILLTGTTQILNSGTIAGRYGIGTYFSGTATVTNFGRITGTGSGYESAINAGVGGQVTNHGTISASGSAGAGVSLGGLLLNAAGGLITAPRYGVLGASTLVNYGTIDARTAIKSGGTVSNKASGFIYRGGVYITGSAAYVTNAGTILGFGVGVSLASAGTVSNTGTLSVSRGGVLIAGAGAVTNQAGARIIGGGYGISITGAGSVTNAGYIRGGSYSGIGMGGGGAVFNQAGGTITGNFHGVDVDSQPATVTNAGTIRGLGGEGIHMFAGGSVVNQAGGTIDSDNKHIFGVFILVGPGYVTNAGYIGGVALRNDGSISNESGGTIGGMGITTVLEPITVANAGFIGGYGVWLFAGGRVINDAGGTIVGTSGTAFASAAGVYIKGGAGTVSNAGTIVGASSGVAVKFGGSFTNRLIVNAGAVFGGGLTGGDGTDTLELAGSAAAPLTVDYSTLGLTNFEQVLFGSGNYATLKVSNTSGTLPVTISGFDATTETIDLTGIGGDGQVTNHDTVNHRVTISGSLGSVTLQLDVSDGTVFLTGPDGADGTNFTIACFCRGSLIRTPGGEVPVETLAIGDRVLTLSGRARPIKWVGRRAYDPRFVRGNRNILPIRVSAGGLAPGVPARDLWLSPAHSLFLEGVLAPVELLVNGASIVQAERAASVEYFHIELDEHDIVFANAAPAETFVDCDNRLMFVNGSEYARLYPDDDRPGWSFCAPRLEKDAPGLTAIRARLLARAARLGLVGRDPDLHLLADGAVVRAPASDGGAHRFSLQAGAGEVRIASRSVVPAETEASSLDQRRLGVPVRRVVLCGAGRRVEIGPGCPVLRDGFHADEGSHRWTDGYALLPPEAMAAIAGDLTVEVHVAATELHYPTDPRARAATAPSAHKPGRRRAVG